MIEIPNNFATALAASSSQYIANLSPVLILVVSVLLGTLVIGAIIGVMKHN